MCAHEKIEKKREISPKKGIGLKKALTLQKIFYEALTGTAEHIENSLVFIKKRQADRRHLDQQIRDAESFEEKEDLLRILAAYCYKEAREWKVKGDVKNQIQWLKLIARFLKLSTGIMEHVQIEKELADLKKQIEELDGEEAPAVP